MTIKEFLDLIESGQITNLDTEIIIDCGNNHYSSINYYDFGEYGLDNKEVYDQIDTKQSIFILG